MDGVSVHHHITISPYHYFTTLLFSLFFIFTPSLFLLFYTSISISYFYFFHRFLFHILFLFNLLHLKAPFSSSINKFLIFSLTSFLIPQTCQPFAYSKRLILFEFNFINNNIKIIAPYFKNYFM